MTTIIVACNFVLCQTSPFFLSVVYRLLFIFQQTRCWLWPRVSWWRTSCWPREAWPRTNRWDKPAKPAAAVSSRWRAGVLLGLSTVTWSIAPFSCCFVKLATTRAIYRRSSKTCPSALRVLYRDGRGGIRGCCVKLYIYTVYMVNVDKSCGSVRSELHDIIVYRRHYPGGEGRWQPLWPRASSTRVFKQSLYI